MCVTKLLPHIRPVSDSFIYVYMHLMSPEREGVGAHGVQRRRVCRPHGVPHQVQPRGESAQYSLFILNCGYGSYYYYVCLVVLAGDVAREEDGLSLTLT